MRFMPKMEDWRSNLRNLTDFIRECGRTRRYRFDQSFVSISSIAEQYYCEAKVDIEYRLGEVSTEVKEEGRRIHEKTLRMRPTTVEELVKSIEKEPVLTCSFPVYAEVGGLVIVGVPDAIIFKNSRPRWLLELKTTSGSVGRIWRDEIVQAGAYAYALDYMGFDCRDLQLAIVKIKRLEESAELYKILFGIVQRFLLGENLKKLKSLEDKIKVLKVHIQAYNKSKVLEDLNWAKDYWLMKRDPIPTRKANKCKACIYKKACKYSLA